VLNSHTSLPANTSLPAIGSLCTRPSLPSPAIFVLWRADRSCWADNSLDESDYFGSAIRSRNVFDDHVLVQVPHRVDSKPLSPGSMVTTACASVLSFATTSSSV